MKTIYLVRHGKSTWLDKSKANDMDRPLKAKGVLQVDAAAKKLEKKNIYPDLIYSSIALRSVHTALIFSRNLSYPESRVKLLPQLYGSDVESIMRVIELTKPEYNSIMVCGHDPSLTNLINLKTEQSIEKIPTASVVALGFECEQWKAIRELKGNQLFFIKSKD